MTGSESSGGDAPLVWTGHNIALRDGTVTMPDVPRPFSRSARFRTVVAALEAILGTSELAGVRIADMGCFEGGFSFGLAQRGACVVGVEARDLNMAKLRWAQERSDLRPPALCFVQADVKDYAAEHPRCFDAVLALGILYHLDDPVGWLVSVSQMAPAVVIDTSVAPASDAELATSKFAERLGPLVELAGDARYEGRWFHEFDPGRDPGPLTLASWSNAESFWLTRESLLRALLDIGYRGVVEYHTRFTLGSRERKERTRVVVAARLDRMPARAGV